MPQRRKLAALAVGALTAVLVGYLTAAPAHGAVPRAGSAGSSGSSGPLRTIDPAVVALMHRQEPLLHAVDRLDALFDLHKSGYAGVRINVPKQTVHLYWHGAVPAEVSALAARLNGPHRKVTIIAAPYTFGQLQAEADRIMTSDHGVVQVLINNDGTGLHAVVNEALGAVRPLSVQSTVATTVERGAQMDPMTRWDDIAPFWGGGVIADGIGDECSAGFAAVQGGTVDGIVTASHCGPGAWETPFSTPIGSVTDDAVAEQYDMEFITTSSAPFVYMAGSDISGNGVGETNDPVSTVRVTPTPAGTMICTDGAFSGEICNAKSDGPMDYTLNGIATVFHGVFAHQINGTNLSGNGDSGGPVISLQGSSVEAEGIISGGDPGFDVPCTGVPIMRTCSSRGAYVPIGGGTTSMDAFPLITSP
ncbi:MAG TPA: hypothetical protein VFX70_07350 [Mycobacteriales bacterium]|nr:hypothetical protein [Mycobacteriales bacterium]